MHYIPKYSRERRNERIEKRQTLSDEKLNTIYKSSVLYLLEKTLSQLSSEQIIALRKYLSK